MRRTQLQVRLIQERLMLFSGWTWVAAGSLVGFEMLDIIFGSFLVAPELLPLVILGLACAFVFRVRLRRVRTRVIARRRAVRLRRRG